LPAAIVNGRGELVTLTLDRVILHTLVHHTSTSTYTQNFKLSQTVGHV